jgi:hypothetical protein
MNQRDLLEEEREAMLRSKITLMISVMKATAMAKEAAAYVQCLALVHISKITVLLEKHPPNQKLSSSSVQEWKDSSTLTVAVQ